MSSYNENLLKRVLDASDSRIWDEAVREWDITDYEEDELCESSCICGKDGIRYLYEITNRETHRILYPIGSCCIKKFHRADLSDEVAIIEGMFKLYRAIQKGERIELDTRYFSRKLLRALLEDDAFKETQYNDYDGYNDYQFLLDMFNQRNRLTPNQQKKVNAIIAFSIRPYLRETLRFKNTQ